MGELTTWSELAPPPMPPEAPTADVQALLDQRESIGLLWSMMARAIAMVAGLLSVPFISEGRFDQVYTLVLIGFGFVLCAWGIVRARRRERLRQVAMTAALYDLLILLTLPISWYISVGGSEVNPAFLLKNEYFAICVLIIIVNTLTVRPLYPMMLGFGSAAMHVLLLVFASYDERVRFSDRLLETFLSDAVHIPVFVFRVFTLVVMAWMLARLTYAARLTLREAVETQVAAAENQREQAELVMEGRLEGLTKLVAGLAHEINGPLGALLSSQSTQRRATQRLREEGVDSRALDALSAGAETSAQAAERIDTLVRRLRAFARLDQSERDRVCMAEKLRSLIDMVPESTRAGVRLRLDLPEDCHLYCRPQALNQALYVILENAFEAVGQDGEVQVGLFEANEGVRICIQDNGPGILEPLRHELFEPRIKRDGRRVGMGLGLPAAKRIVEAHGGSIRFHTSSRGTRFDIFLRSLVDA
ncbi:MAG: HAMP domain-containing sensor histidine kinase [Myxococcota bacterium]